MEAKDRLAVISKRLVELIRGSKIGFGELCIERERNEGPYGLVSPFK